MRVSLVRFCIARTAVSVMSAGIYLGAMNHCLSQEQATNSYSTDNSSVNQVRVLIDGTWTTPEQLAVDNRKNSVLQEYVSLRYQAEDSFAGQTELARWCQRRKLTEQRDAHLKRALSHNPESRPVRKQLGHVNVDGAWLSREQVAAEQSRVSAAKRRFTDWKKPVTGIAWMLSSSSKKRQHSGQQQLDEIDDPRSITALENILAPVNEVIAEKALEVIDRFSQREATESVLRIAMFSPWLHVQLMAIDSLAERNRYDYVPLLMEQMVSPLTTQFAITANARGNVLYQYVLYQQDMERDSVRQFETLLLQNPRNLFARQSEPVWEAWQRSRRAEQFVNVANEHIETKNRTIQRVLRSTTGAEPGNKPEDWWRWWYEENDVTVYERPVSYTLVQSTEMTTERRPGTSGECLVAGTPIWTERGPLPVESLMVGDRVLCRNFETHDLEYCTVLQPTQRPPTPTYRITLDDQECIQASGGHLFWGEQHGWMKVRDLKPGMQMATACAIPVTIRHIELSDTVPLYNLIVNRQANYFVGAGRILSHDSTIHNQGEKSVDRLARK